MTKKKYMRTLSMFLSLIIVLSMFPGASVQTIAAETGDTDWVEMQVENGDFEEEPASESDLPSWDYWTSGYMEGMSITDEFAYEGDRSLRVDNDGVVGLFSQQIQVTEGNDYKVEAKLFIEEKISGNPGIWLRWINENGSIIGNDAKYFDSALTGEWQTVRVDGTAPAGAVGVKVFIYQTSTTKTKGYYDNVKLFEKSDAISLDLANPGFEMEPSDGEIPKWNKYPASPRENTSVELDENQVYSGERSVKITDQSSGASVGLYSSAVEVVPGMVYTVVGKAFLESGSTSVYLKYYDSAGSEVGSYRTSFSTPVGQWVTVKAEGVAPDNAVSAKIFLYAGVAGQSVSYYDDLSITTSKQLELPFEFGEPINLGPAALSAKSQGVEIGDGEVYYATNGSPATFFAADSETGEMIFSESLPGNDVIWGMTIGTDGNVYFSGTYNGILYKYVVDERRLEKVGKNPSDDWVWELETSSDGKIYGATYPNAKVFEYDINTGEFTDLGSFNEEQDYARGIGVTDESLYVGVGTTAHLYRMDRETGERTEIELPITGESTSVSNIWEFGNNLFVVYGTSMLVVDKETGEVYKSLNWQDKNTIDGLISEPSPYDENIIYYRSKQSSELYTYNMETYEIAPVEPRIQLPASPIKEIKWIKNDSGEFVLAMLNQQIEYSVYNPQTNTLEVSYPEVDLQGLNIQSLEIGEDQQVYMGGYQGSFGVFDTSKEEYVLRERDPQQIEGIGFLNGDAYLGTYGGAMIYKYDPEQPFAYSGGVQGDNPEMVYDIGDEQSRPFTFASGDDKLFVGTISDYGELGGALTINDSVTGEWKTIRNIIEDQSIIGLAYQDGTLFGGSTIAGGLGIDPTEERAKMFTFDVETEATEVFDLEVEGIKTPEMIGELSFGPDGNLWGIAYGKNEEGLANSAVFAMDPETREIVKSVELYEGVSGGSRWRPFFIRWDKQGLMYTTAGRKLTVIDPETLANKELLPGAVHLMDVDQEGNIYYADGADLYKLPVPIEEANLSMEETKIVQGDKSELDLSVTLANAQKADLNGAEIKWLVTDSNIAVIENGELSGKNAGSTEIQAVVTYNGEEVTSNTITVTVDVTTDSLTSQIEEIEANGMMELSLSKQLVNRLRQAKLHYSQGRVNQAVKQLDDFLKLLENGSLDHELKAKLEGNLQAIKENYLED
ncbi:carbohydrate binding domain-containing protein [Aquibacillus sp. 3ASR75-11]|uniref:Carbohydrate binding domain-containing protein n=1 Tax=Terrihalobacillus insolitus TaxID=2950438 RepID=A0A9X3WTM8_9BACI|nr:carbohydrate binding domain-containing protein [Terrihalobacillus insolitus]MDC3423124.1 carbohydrate binding domain-containing protein [Terrihalobacillus insolitus]